MHSYVADGIGFIVFYADVINGVFALYLCFALKRHPNAVIYTNIVRLKRDVLIDWYADMVSCGL